MLREWISPFFSNPCSSCRSRSHFVFVSFSWAYFSRIFSKVVFFLLILSYLAIKLVPFGRVTCFGNVLLLKTIFCLIFFVCVLIFSLIYALYRKSFQKWDELFLLKLELLLIQVVSQVLLYLFVFFFSPNIPNTFFYILFSSCHSKKSSSLWWGAYVLCFKVSPLFVKMYKYSDRE